MAHKAIAVHHDPHADNREVEYQSADEAIRAAIQFQHGVGVKSVHVVDDNGKRVWPSPEAERQPNEKRDRAEDQGVLKPAAVDKTPVPKRAI